MSRATTFPSTTVTCATDTGTPSRSLTSPGAPLISTTRGDVVAYLLNAIALRATRVAPTKCLEVLASPVSRRSTTLGSSSCRRGVEVTALGGLDPRVDQLALANRVVGAGRQCRCLLHPPPGATGELAGRVDTAIDDRSDLVERQAEAVVEYERQPFQRRQRLEHDQQGEADAVGEHRGTFRVAAIRGGDDRVGDEHVE
jgi:hypothetical protein